VVFIPESSGIIARGTHNEIAWPRTARAKLKGFAPDRYAELAPMGTVPQASCTRKAV
jgi:hypothetical protein